LLLNKEFLISNCLILFVSSISSFFKFIKISFFLKYEKRPLSPSKKLKKNYFLLISTFLILYFFFNLLDGERGLFSYFKKKEILVNLKIEEANLSNKIKDLEFKNSLLTTKLDLDYVETLIREKFMFGKEGETLYIIKKNEN